MARIRRQHEFLRELASRSSVVKAMNLDAKIKDGNLQPHAFNLANDEAHIRLVARAVDGLIASKACSEKYARELITGMIQRQTSTYGNFVELAAYNWLMDEKVQVSAQVPMSESEILGVCDAVLDGAVDEQQVYFDVKGFGFHGSVVQALQNRLENKLPGFAVHVENSWDLPIKKLEQIIKDVPEIARELRHGGVKQIGRLGIRVNKPSRVNTSIREVSPYLLAKENASFPFHSANQFTKNAPFMLIYGVHPWFNQSAIFNDFASADSTFARAFARRAFMQWTGSSRALNEVCEQVDASITFADAARHLSAILFLNLWPGELASDRPAMPSQIYLNPRALYPINREGQFWRRSDRPILADDFADDDY